MVQWIIFILLLRLRDCYGDFDVDVVFTHITEPTMKLYNQIRVTCSSSSGSNQQRFRDTGTFQYSLRSVEKYLPWVRKIYIVSNGENPCWLRGTERVIFVNHSDIWPSEFASIELPTFNSVAIESHLHRISGLSEHFIYLNDDMIFGKPLPKSYFFNTTSGIPFTSVKDMFWLPYEMVEIERGTLSGTRPGSYMGYHGPYTARISDMTRVQELWPDYFRVISGMRCRAPVLTHKFEFDYRSPFWVLQWYGIARNYSIPVARDIRFLNMFEDQTAYYQSALTSPPSEMYIINDDFSVDPSEADAQLLAQQDFLERQFGLDLFTSFGAEDSQLSYFNQGCVLNTDLVTPRTQPLIPLIVDNTTSMSSTAAAIKKSAPNTPVINRHPAFRRVRPGSFLRRTSLRPVIVPVGVGHWGEPRSTAYFTAPFGKGSPAFTSSHSSSRHHKHVVTNKEYAQIDLAFLMVPPGTSEEDTSWTSLCRALQYPTSRQTPDVVFVNRLSSNLQNISGGKPTNTEGGDLYRSAHLLADCLGMNYVAVRYESVVRSHSRFTETATAKLAARLRSNDLSKSSLPASQLGIILSKFVMRDVFVMLSRPTHCDKPVAVFGAAIPLSSCLGPSSEHSSMGCTNNSVADNTYWLDVVLVTPLPLPPPPRSSPFSGSTFTTSLSSSPASCTTTTTQGTHLRGTHTVSTSDSKAASNGVPLTEDERLVSALGAHRTAWGQKRLMTGEQTSFSSRSSVVVVDRWRRSESAGGTKGNNGAGGGVCTLGQGAGGLRAANSNGTVSSLAGCVAVYKFSGDNKTGKENSDAIRNTYTMKVGQIRPLLAGTKMDRAAAPGIVLKNHLLRQCITHN